MEKSWQQIKRGDIYLVVLPPGRGCEQSGTRPAIIVSNDVGNKFSPNVIAVPITSSLDKARLPTHVPLYANDSGLRFDSMILAENPVTLSKDQLRSYLGSLDDDLLQKVDKAVGIAVGLTAVPTKEGATA